MDGIQGYKYTFIVRVKCVRGRDQERELCDRVLEEKDVLYWLSLQGT